MGPVVAACALVAVLCGAVVVGFDMGVALVLHPVLARMDPDAADALAGRLLQQVPKLRVFSFTAVVATAALMVAARVGTGAGSLAMAALAFLLIQLLLTIKVTGPDDASRPAGGRGGRDERRHLQAGDDRLHRARWESVMVPRAVAGMIGLTCLVASVLLSGRFL